MSARSLPAPDPVRWALALWLVAGVAVSVRTLVSPERHTVFPIFAASATHWWADAPLYVSYSPLDTFRYPPIFAVAVTPVAALGLRAGGVCWVWAGLAVYLHGLWCFARDVAPGRWTCPRQAAFLTLGLLGALRGLWNAQSNALAVGLLLLAASALARALSLGGPPEGGETDADRRRQRGRWWRAAALLAAAVCLKLTPLAPALLLCALWPRRLAGRFVVALAAGFLGPLLTRPPAVVAGHYAAWLGHLVQSSGERWLGFRDGWTFWLAVRHLAGGLAGPLPVCHPVDTPAYRLVQLLAAVGALAWCLWQRRAGARLGAGWLVHVTLAAGMAWLMLFGPAVEHATYVFLAPPLAWAVVQREAWARGRALLGAASFLVLVLGWGAVSRQVAGVWPPAGELLLAALPAGTALFALWLVGYAAACVRLPAGSALPDALPADGTDAGSAPAREASPERPRRRQPTVAAP
jgi:hypothetical protein